IAPCPMPVHASNPPARTTSSGSTSLHRARRSIRTAANTPRRSLAGHVFYSISDGTVERGYGFSPVESGTGGPGHVVRDEPLAYRSPAYIRTMEITEVQYEALLTYGESALNKDERHFNLQYAGATNSCIDFTWGALNR